MIKHLIDKKFFLSSITVFLIFSTDLWAMAPAADGQGKSVWLQMLPLLLVFVVFFLLVIWPQQRKMKKHRAMVNELGKGDEVITSAGILGTVQKLHEDQRTVYLEVSDKTAIRVTKESIAQIISSKNAKDSKPTK